MASKEKWPRRRKYMDDFRQAPNGEYIYVGNEYHWVSERKPVLIRLWAFVVLSAAATVANGCLPQAQMEGHFYILLPYLVQFLGCVLQVWAMCRLSWAGERVREFIAERSLFALPTRCLVTAIAAGVTFLAELAMALFTEFSGKIWAVILYLVLELLVVAASLLARKTARETSMELHPGG